MDEAFSVGGSNVVTDFAVLLKEFAVLARRVSLLEARLDAIHGATAPHHDVEETGHEPG